MSDVDWKAAEEAAAKLGVHTRKLVAERDPVLIGAWALQNERSNTEPRATSYRELAVLVGFVHPREPEPEPGREEAS